MADYDPPPPKRSRALDAADVAGMINRETREISHRVYTDRDLYELELEKLWAKAWIAIAHDSEIPNVGDFVTRRVGDDPVIVIRDKDGVKCLLNVCPHRGAAVCRTDRGNAPLLRCIYHGWTFARDGTFRGAPFKGEMYPQGFDKQSVSIRAARVEVCAGIVFMCWDEDAPPLDEYLGDFRWYLKALLERTDDGLEVVGSPQRFVINANWKVASEQFAGDAYHASQLHKSLGELRGMDPNDPQVWGMCDTKVATLQGHGVICFHQANRFGRSVPGFADLPAIEKLRLFPPPGMPSEMVDQLPARFPPHELNALADTPPSNGIVFPNLGIWSTTSMLPDGTLTSFLSLRTYVPHGVDQFEFVMWVLAEKGSSDTFRENMLRVTSLAQGAAGFVEQDDAEVWPSASAGGRGFIGRQNTLKYLASSEHQPPPDWPGGGIVATDFSRDDSQWLWWNRYFDFLTQ